MTDVGFSLLALDIVRLQEMFKELGCRFAAGLLYIGLYMMSCQLDTEMLNDNCLLVAGCACDKV